jgi:hypothetical protein
LSLQLLQSQHPHPLQLQHQLRSLTMQITL